MKKVIELTHYNSRWPKIFGAESTCIEAILRHNCPAVHHIGSISVSGLIDKSIIDVTISNPVKAQIDLDKVLSKIL